MRSATRRIAHDSPHERRRVERGLVASAAAYSGLIFGRADDLAPFLGVFGDELAEVGGRAGQHGAPMSAIHSLSARARCVSTGRSAESTESTVSTLFLIGCGWRPLARLPPRIVIGATKDPRDCNGGLG